MAKIIILETNQVFDSITAAARSVGVDPSNARKAVKGQRQTAGGYHFSTVEAAPLRRESIVQEITEKKIRKAVSAERKRLLQTVHERMVDINKRLRNAQKENLFDQDPVLQQMVSHTDFYGRNKRGGYLSSVQNLRQFSDEELQNFMLLTTKDQAEYLSETYSAKNRNLASYAAEFGLNNEQMARYWWTLPAIYDMYYNAKLDTEFKYSDRENKEMLQARISRMMKEGRDPEELFRFITDLNNFFQGNTKQSLNDILKKYAKNKKGGWQKWS